MRPSGNPGQDAGTIPLKIGDQFVTPVSANGRTYVRTGARRGNEMVCYDLRATAP